MNAIKTITNIETLTKEWGEMVESLWKCEFIDIDEIKNYLGKPLMSCINIVTKTMSSKKCAN